MSAIYLMIPVALILGFGFLGAFIWMASQGQFDDLRTPPMRALLNESPVQPSEGKATENEH